MLAIVVGNEGQGVSDDVIDLADVVVTIPMFWKSRIAERSYCFGTINV